MSKYIIELGEDANMVQVISVTQSGNAYVDSTVYVGYLEQLTADYINRHFSDMQDIAYRKGRESVFHELEISGSQKGESAKEAYQRGFEDGKAVNDKGCEGCMYQDNTIEHHPCGVCCNAYNNRWKAKQTDDKIEVGDEVEPFYTDITGVVTLIDGDTIYILWRDGLSISAMKLKEVTKTGRHFDIASILEEMKHE